MLKPLAAAVLTLGLLAATAPPTRADCGASTIMVDSGTSLEVAQIDRSNQDASQTPAPEAR